MRGKVLSYNDLEGVGVISGDDGKRYNFVRGDLQDGVRTVRVGADVDFDGADDKAAKIYVMGGGTASSAGDGINEALNTFSSGDKSRIVAAVLAIVLGGLGIHKFYLGLNKEGIIMLVVSFAGAIIAVGPIVMALVGLVEGVIYLTKSDEEFQRIYVEGKKAWL